MTESEKVWNKLHGKLLGNLELQGISKSNLFILTGKAVKLGKTSKLAEVLSGQLMGVNANTSVKSPWELKVDVVPFHISAAMALTSVIVKKPVLYDRFYQDYIKRVDQTIELMEGTDGRIEDDANKILQKHAKQTHHWIATMYDLSGCFEDDSDYAKKGIRKWIGKLFAPWDATILTWREVVMKKRLADDLKVAVTEEYSDEYASDSGVE